MYRFELWEIVKGSNEPSPESFDSLKHSDYSDYSEYSDYSNNSNTINELKTSKASGFSFHLKKLILTRRNV